MVFCPNFTHVNPALIPLHLLRNSWKKELLPLNQNRWIIIKGYKTIRYLWMKHTRTDKLANKQRSIPKIGSKQNILKHTQYYLEGWLLIFSVVNHSLFILQYKLIWIMVVQSIFENQILQVSSTWWQSLDIFRPTEATCLYLDILREHTAHPWMLNSLWLLS
jgi:hypothetical protein